MFFSLLSRSSNRFVFVTTLPGHVRFTQVYNLSVYVTYTEKSWASNEEHVFQFVMLTVYVNTYNLPRRHAAYGARDRSENENKWFITTFVVFAYWTTARDTTERKRFPEVEITD